MRARGLVARAVKVVLSVLAAAMFTRGQVAAQPLPTRVNIDILIVSDDPIAATRMKQWSNALISRLSKISDDRSLGMKRRIDVLTFPQQGFVGANVLQVRWQQRRAIQIVLAQGVNDGNQVTAEGDLFLGALKGDLAGPSVPIKQPITPENFQKASDYIVLTSLYALSVDAGSQKPVVCALLRQADLLGRTIKASVDSANVKGAVAKRLAAAKCAIGR